MNYEQMLAAKLKPHDCAIENCKCVIDGVMMFCARHWNTLTYGERESYLNAFCLLSECSSANNRYHFYQVARKLGGLIRDREVGSIDASLEEDIF